jgi:hypothetical protein
MPDLSSPKGPILHAFTLLAKGGACALFIDIIGMPRTPYSYAGAARRGFRRGFY